MKNHSLTALLVCLIVSCLTTQAGPTRNWDAVGDDGMEGRATGYVMAVSQDSTQLIVYSIMNGGWQPAAGLLIIPANELPAPALPGTLETFTIDTDGWESGTWFVTVKAFDEASNYAPLGNIARFEVEDTIAPAAILTLQ